MIQLTRRNLLASSGCCRSRPCRANDYRGAGECRGARGGQAECGMVPLQSWQL
jgi:hypothetical protein